MSIIRVVKAVKSFQSTIYKRGNEKVFFGVNLLMDVKKATKFERLLGKTRKSSQGKSQGTKKREWTKRLSYLYRSPTSRRCVACSTKKLCYATKHINTNTTSTFEWALDFILHYDEDW